MCRWRSWHRFRGECWREFPAVFRLHRNWCREAGAHSVALGTFGGRVPFTNILNACATGGSSLLSACKEIQSGASEIGLVVGFDKHDRGAFNARPSEYGLGDWYVEAVFMLTTQFFAAKIQKYMHDHRITTDTLARVVAKAYRNGALNLNAWRRTPGAEQPDDRVHARIRGTRHQRRNHIAEMSRVVR
jgi:acetyl-CoA acetyltransferase